MDSNSRKRWEQDMKDECKNYIAANMDMFKYINKKPAHMKLTVKSVRGAL